MLEEYDFRNDTVSLYGAVFPLNPDVGRRIVSTFNYVHIFCIRSGCLISMLILGFLDQSRLGYGTEATGSTKAISGKES